MNSLQAILFICFLVSAAVAGSSSVVNSAGTVSSVKVLRYRCGEAIRIGKKRKQKLTFPFMVKAFFGSMIDPTYAGEVDVPKPEKEGKGSKGKKQKLGSG